MYLISLTAQESEILSDYVKSCPIETIRLRAHALLMRNRSLSLEDISPLVFRSQRTVTRWLEEFSEKRLASIFSGHIDNQNASKLTRDQKRQIKEVLSTPPNKYGIPKEFWSVSKLKDYIKATFGVVYESDISYHFLLQFSGLSFKYPDKTSPRRDEELIAKRIQEIKINLFILFRITFTNIQYLITNFYSLLKLFLSVVFKNISRSFEIYRDKFITSCIIL